MTRKQIKEKAIQLHDDMRKTESFEGSSGWCNRFMKRFRLTTRMKTHQSQKSQPNLIPKVIEFLRYTSKTFQTCIWTAFRQWTNQLSVSTPVGAKSVSLTTTGQDKQIVNVALTATASGAKNCHFCLQWKG